jgi:hypothetical protein
MITYGMYAAVAALIIGLVWWFTHRPKKDGFEVVPAAPVEEIGVEPVENEAYSEEEEDEDEEEDYSEEEEDYEEDYEEPAKADDSYDDAASVESD